MFQMLHLWSFNSEVLFPDHKHNPKWTEYFHSYTIFTVEMVSVESLCFEIAKHALDLISYIKDLEIMES